MVVPPPTLKLAPPNECASEERGLNPLCEPSPPLTLLFTFLREDCELPTIGDGTAAKLEGAEEVLDALEDIEGATADPDDPVAATEVVEALVEAVALPESRALK